jgi:hypothetical protein
MRGRSEAKPSESHNRDARFAVSVKPEDPLICKYEFQPQLHMSRLRLHYEALDKAGCQFASLFPAHPIPEPADLSQCLNGGFKLFILSVQLLQAIPNGCELILDICLFLSVCVPNRLESAAVRAGIVSSSVPRKPFPAPSERQNVAFFGTNKVFAFAFCIGARIFRRRAEQTIRVSQVTDRVGDIVYDLIRVDTKVWVLTSGMLPIARIARPLMAVKLSARNVPELSAAYPTADQTLERENQRRRRILDC